MPKILTFGSGEVESTDNILNGDNENETYERRSGQILWIRGLTRLQTQVWVKKIYIFNIKYNFY